MALPAEVKAALDRAAALDRQAGQTRREAADQRHRAVLSLRQDYRLSTADIARLLGVTRQRVYQLLKARPGDP